MFYSFSGFGCFIAFLLLRPNLVMSGGRKYVNNLRNSLISLTFQEKKRNTDQYAKYVLDKSA